MADIRFQISGSSAPFIAKICNTGSNTVLQQMAIDYSGTCCNSCNIFWNLNPSASYTLNIEDNIGHSISCIYSTPVQVGTTTLATKSICLSGTSVNPSGEFECYLTNNLVVIPPLSQGETLTVCFATCAVGGGGTGVSSSVSISCCSNGMPWQTLVNRSNNNNCIVETPITLNFGDKLCYNLTSIGYFDDDTISINGCAILELKDATPYGFNRTIINNTLTTSVSYTLPPPTTTTTTTTTAAPAPFIGTVSNVVQNNTKSVTLTFNGLYGSGNYNVYIYNNPTFIPVGSYTGATRFFANAIGAEFPAPLSSTVTYSGNLPPNYGGSVYMRIRVTDNVSGLKSYGKMVMYQSPTTMGAGNATWSSTPW
jgi:hypothetical protein